MWTDIKVSSEDGDTSHHITIRHQIPEDHDQNFHRQENLKPRITFLILVYVQSIDILNNVQMAVNDQLLSNECRKRLHWGQSGRSVKLTVPPST